jgi:long-chain acyl-CoA synthetase
MIELSNGERFSPQFIEGRLKFNPYVRDVMSIGDPSRDFVSALIIFDFDNVARWAEKQGIGFTTFADLSQKPPILNLIKAAVEEINASLPPDGRIKAFVLMPKEFDADEAEMTRSRKLKRQVLVEKYGEIIEALYDSSAENITVRQEITYQDGSTGFTENRLSVVRL